MKRWVFNILCLLSFLLFICFLFLWIWTQSNELSLRRRFNSQKQNLVRDTDIHFIAGRFAFRLQKMQSSVIEPSGIYEVSQWYRPRPAPKPYHPFEYSIRPFSGPGYSGFDCLGVHYLRSIGPR